MSKNLTRKGLALGTALAFVVTGLTATAPAYAAAGDVVSIAPTTGTGYGAYNTDYLSIDTEIDTDVVTATSYSKLAIQLDNSTSANLNVKLNDGLGTQTFTANSAGTADVCTAPVSYRLFNDSSEEVATADYTVTASFDGIADAAACATRLADTAFTIDMSAVGSPAKDYTHVVFDLKEVAGSSPVKISLKSADAADKAENIAVGVTAWIDTDESESQESTDKYPSTKETATFYDPANVTMTPRVERYIGTAANLNGNTADALAVSVAFSPALNLDQVIANNATAGAWNSSSAIDFDARDNWTAANSTALGTSGTWTAVQTAAVVTFEKLAGNTTYSAGGKLYGLIDNATAGNFSLGKGRVYTFKATHTTAAAHLTTSDASDDAVNFTSGGFTVPSQSTDGTAATTPIAAADVVVDQADDSFQTTDTTIGLRSGVKTFKYTAKVTPKVVGTSIVSNVPVIAEVTATVLGSGNTLTVNGNKLSDNQAVLVSGVTDADGKFSVSVESSAAKTGEAYTVVLHTLQNSGSYDPTGTYTATYAAGAATVMTQASAILAGTTVEAKYTLKDQFGKVISASAAGTAYTVRLQAGDTTKLKKYATFANGVATVSFTNYLAKGQSDALTAAIGTGVDTAYADAAITTGDQLSASLYNPESAAAVTTAATLTAQEITYDAFITGAADAVTNIAPSNLDDFQLTGTVVDTTGAGIPGAVVTVSAKGLQFVKSAATVASGDYAKDTITVVADAAGSYEVSVWAHKVSSTGIVITTTSGGKSATTKVVTTGNGLTVDAGNEITADDLVFTWNAPKHPGIDTTYIVTGKVTDKWGNPISAAEVTVDADGALEVNGNTSVTRKTNTSGIFRVYFRSLPKVDGIANITATLTKVVVAGTYLDTLQTTTTANATVTGVAIVAANSELTAGETFVNALSSDVNVGVDATAIAGSKAGTAKATVYNAKGKTVVVYVAGKKVATKKATSAAYSVTVKAKAGAVVKVVVGSTTYFNEAVN